MKDRVKILFSYDGSVPGSIEVETLWAIPSANGFKLDNIPFFAREVSVGDVVSAKPDLDGMLRFGALVKASQNSTVRLWFAKNKENEVARVRQNLRDLGCSSEISDLPRLVAVDIPATISYAIVRKVLDEYEKVGLLEYEESCLGRA